MRYKWLVLDHDDTVVDSTASIHYPAFLEALKILRPGVQQITLEEYFEENFDPGFIEMCQRRYQLTDAELDVEVECWRKYVENHIPKAYPGMRKIITRHKEEGGCVCVVSHSYDFNIRRDYKANCLPEPDMIFGWECEPQRRKPAPYALEQIMEKYGLQPQEMVMIDDLKPGYDMARSVGVPFIGAGWANDIAKIRTFMKQNSDYYFTNVKELEKFLFS